mmetsp:Transcript_52068/g.114293  ORF Transcript_52068/g.114293 Transcript_52068/m.114293 type:complete len:267 (+) Transcript_52068:272-1072(+)
MGSQRKSPYPVSMTAPAMCGGPGPSWDGLCPDPRWQQQGQPPRKRLHQENSAQFRRCPTPSVARTMEGLQAELKLRHQADPDTCLGRRRPLPGSSASLPVLRGKRRARADGRWLLTATAGRRRRRSGQPRRASWLGTIGMEALGSLLGRIGPPALGVDWPIITRPYPARDCRRTCATCRLPRSCSGMVVPSSLYFQTDQLTCCRLPCRRVMSCRSHAHCLSPSPHVERRPGLRDRCSVRCRHLQGWSRYPWGRQGSPSFDSHPGSA